MYTYQENSLRLLHMGGQNVLTGAPLSLTGAFIGIARISRDWCITPGGPVVRRPQVAHGLQRGPFALDEGSYRIKAQGIPAGDRVLIGAINISKELRLLQEASYVYQGNSLRQLLIVGQKIVSRSQGPHIVLEKPFVSLKGSFIVEPSIE